MKKHIVSILSAATPRFINRDFRIMSHIARHLMAFVFVPNLHRCLKFYFRFDDDFQTIIRHSAASSSDYHIFWSDIDLSFVLSEKDIIQSQNLARVYNKLRSVFIFLGESEIYTIDEFNRYRQLTSSESNLFQKLRDLRKIGWIEDENRDLLSPYHKAKYKRGIQKIIQKFGLEFYPDDFGNIQKMPQPIEDILKTVTPIALPHLENKEFHVFSDYLGFQVAQSHQPLNAGERTLSLRHPYGLLLLAIVPSTNLESPLKEDLNLLRNDVQLKKIHDELLEIEMILLTAVYRARFNIFPWMPEKVRSLQKLRID